MQLLFELLNDSYLLRHVNAVVVIALPNGCDVAVIAGETSLASCTGRVAGGTTTRSVVNARHRLGSVQGSE